jgi:hypothetical protein
MSQALVPYEERVGALSVNDVRSQVNLIQMVMREVMKKDEHYGVIPGTGTKPTLLKAGAEKLCLTFRLDPQYEITERQEGPHLTVTSKCTLWHIPSGQRFGSGMGSCSTRESKYAYRQAQRKCPNCGAEAIIKGKDFKNEGKPTGWICFSKKGGCGTKFKDGAPEIESQKVGRTPNEDLADQYNTVLKMANKRSLVAAVLNATAASDIFTQDIEDLPQPKASPMTEEDQDITQEIPGAGVPISLEQALALRAEFLVLGKKAEEDTLRIAKVSKVEDILASDYDGIMKALAKRRAKAATTPTSEAST